MRVLIVGAGLGGLCLAHGLRGAGVDVRVLERRPAADHQPASYGIHLNADGLRALHACLPDAGWRQLVASSVPAHDVVRFHDEQLRVLAVRDHDASVPDPVTRRRAIRRDALRDALLAGLDTDTVRWGCAYVDDVVEPDGRVRVRSSDGVAEVADVVVGADGANSAVRHRHLPGFERQDLGIVTTVGRVPLTPEVRAVLPLSLVDGAVNNVVPSGPGWMFVSTWTGADAAATAIWAWVGERAQYPADVDRLPPRQLHDIVSTKIAGWSPALRRLVAATDPTTVGLVPLRTMPELPMWTPSAVTLLGDAAHNMTPMAGIGANTALRDADVLRRHLLAPGPGTVVERIGRYEAVMRVYANEALALSTRNARRAASPARLPRRAFRTVLRIAEAVPPVKRSMFGAPPAA